MVETLQGSGERQVEKSPQKRKARGEPKVRPAKSLIKGEVVTHARGLVPLMGQTSLRCAMASKRKELHPVGGSVIQVMIHGLPPKFLPLTFVEACKSLGFVPGKVLGLTQNPKFKEEMKAQLETRRAMEWSRNMAVAMDIRDTPGDGTPHASEIRLRAIYALEGPSGKRAPAVQVNVTQTNAAEKVSPGYVIRLSDPDSKTIEHED
jgi:hypothetical protein